jgi:predicted MFS family arabinose efflux permease
MRAVEGRAGHPDVVTGARPSVPALLGETLAVQALGTLAVLIIPALAPTVARTLDVPTSTIGYQVALEYLAAVLASLFAGGAVAAFGPCRTGQIAMLLTAAGCAVASVPHLLTVIAGSLLIGSAYGLINPAASELLIRHSPPNRRNFIFSLKQTGVPLGGAAAGLLGPRLALALDWNAVLWIAAAACVVLAALSQRGRATLDRHRAGSTKPVLESFRALGTVLGTPALRWLALSSFCFSLVQLCSVTFLVALLVEDLGFDLVSAGTILAAVQISGAIGRVTWGLVADAVRDGLGVLLGLGLLMAMASAVIVAFVPGWPRSLAVLTFVILGFSAVAWNGLYLSEVARLSPAREVSATTGAAMFFTFTGVVVGPALFSAVHDVLGNYTPSYGLLVGFALAGTMMIGAVRFRRASRDAVRPKLS